MAGHSKWSTIKHKKAANDAKRGKAFGKLIRAIESTAREAGTSDPEVSAALAMAVQKARDASVPKDNIERACKRGAGELDGAAQYESVTYEGYAPGGVAVLVDVLTDNRNRTASDIRRAFSVAGGSLAEPGSVAFQFTRRGQVLVDATGVDEESLLMAGLDAGMEDLESGDDHFVAWCDPTQVVELRTALEAAGFSVTNSGSTMVPAATVPVSDESETKQILRLFETLDDNDDVQDVYANAELDDDLLAALDV